jgi:phage baseplate assembly protein gpV
VKVLTINDVLPNNDEELYHTIMDTASANIRVAMPGIVQSFNATEQTVTVQLAIRERVKQPDLTYKWLAIPLLVDVPIAVPRAGGFSLTFPIQQGDECLVIFGDMAMDAWWANGGIQNQVEKRRHDLSDGYAILGVWSQPHVVSNYSTSAAELRTDDGSVSVSLSASGVTITGDVTINGALTTTGALTSPTAEIGGIAMTTHTHVAPSGGGTTSGPS